MQYLKAVETVLVAVLNSQINAARLLVLQVFARLRRFVVQHFYSGKCNPRCFCLRSFPLKPMNLNWLLLEDFSGVLNGCCFRP